MRLGSGCAWEAEKEKREARVLLLFSLLFVYLMAEFDVKVEI